MSYGSAARYSCRRAASRPTVRRRILGAQQLADRHDQRRVADDARAAVDLVGQLREGAAGCSCAGPWRPRGRGALRMRPSRRRPQSANWRSMSRRAYQTSIVRIAANVAHGLAVGANRRCTTMPRCAACVEATVAARDHEARRQALDVPLPRPGQGLVEVVEIEDEAAMWRSEGAEVRQVRVAAQLHVQSGDRAWPRGRRP